VNFLPKQHLKIGNYVKYIDEILHKCDKGIEYCKICPNAFVCTELEKDDFDLEDSTISAVLTAIQHTLNKIPGYLNPGKRNELEDHVKRYINELPLHERGIWEDSILDILLDNKLANPSYKPKAKIGEVRVLLTYGAKISFSTCLKCLLLENAVTLLNNTIALPSEITLNSTKIINQFVHSKHIDVAIPPMPSWIKYCVEEDITEIIQRCNLNDIGLASALCYYAVLTRSPIPGNIAITGGLDNQGNILRVDYLDGKTETVLRELHFIDKIVIPKGSSFSIHVPANVKIIEVGDPKQAIDVVFRNSM